MSAASFLGIAGLVSLSGFDGLIYSIGFLVGWPIVMFLIAEPLRNLGRYTFADVVAFRLRQAPGAHRGRHRHARGRHLLPDRADGRRRQPDQAALRHPLRDGHRDRRHRDDGLRALRRHARDHLGADRQGGAADERAPSCWRSWCSLRFALQPARRSSPPPPTASAASVLGPGQLVADPLDAISLGLALMFGTAGLPHILMRFYTVPDARTARTSVSYATGVHRLLLPADVHPRLRRDGASSGPDAIKAVDKGGNMAAPLLAEAVGGTRLPRLHRRGGVRHDPGRRRRADALRARPRSRTTSGSTWCAGARRPEREQLVRGAGRDRSSAAWPRSRSASSSRAQNVAYMVGLAFAIAASANFPALVLSIFWRRFTTRGRAGQHDRGDGLGPAPDLPLARRSR